MATPKRAITQLAIEFETEGDVNEALTTHFSTIRIVNSTRSIWPIFYVYFYVDNQIFIEKNIYGKKDITCKIWYTGDTGEKTGSPIEYKLLYLEANIDLPAKEEKNTPIDDAKEVQRRHVCVTCLAKPAYLAMTAFVNKLWEDPDGTSGTGMIPIDFIYELLNLNGIEYRIFDDGKNEDAVQQMLVPPMTMRGAVDYINQNYGIFSGPLFRYANYAGQFLMWDLRKMYEKHKNSPWVKMLKSPSHFETDGKFEEINNIAAASDDEFVTHDMGESIHHANANVIRFGYDNIYIYHPHEDIAVFQKKKIPEIIPDYGIWHNSEEMKYHEDLKNRKLYYHDMKGHEIGTGYSGEYNNFILKQDMATSFQNAAALRIMLYRNVKIHMVQKVGEVLYLEPYLEHEKYSGSNYRGGYLISDSEIVLTREQRGKQEDNLNCMATLTAYRTTQSMD